MLHLHVMKMNKFLPTLTIFLSVFITCFAEEKSEAEPYVIFQPSKEKIHNPHKLDQQPLPTRQMFPSYPKEMRKKKQGGDVKICLVIDEEGAPKHVFCVIATNEIFANSILEVIGRYHWTPAVKNGSPVQTITSIGFEFVTPKNKGKNQRIIPYEVETEFWKEKEES